MESHVAQTAKMVFGTHSLQVNKPATGFNRPIESRLNHQ